MSQGNSGIAVKPLLFEQVLETLCTSDRSRHEEREQIMIDFLQTGVLEQFLRNQPQEELRLVTMAESAGFFRVVEMLHVKHRRYSQALSTYWKDAMRGEKIFSFVRMVFMDNFVTLEEKENLKKDVMENLDRFVKIDAKKTSRLMLDVFEVEMSQVLIRFEHDEEALFYFLQVVFQFFWELVLLSHS